MNEDPDIEDGRSGLGIGIQILEPLWWVHEDGDRGTRRPGATWTLSAHCQKVIEKGRGKIRKVVEIAIG